MNERDAFLEKIRENPDDTTAYLVYSDWLEEHGEIGRAQLIRRQVEFGPDSSRAPEDWMLQSFNQLRDEHHILHVKTKHGFFSYIALFLESWIRAEKLIRSNPDVVLQSVKISDLLRERSNRHHWELRDFYNNRKLTLGGIYEGQTVTVTVRLCDQSKSNVIRPHFNESILEYVKKAIEELMVQLLEERSPGIKFLVRY